MKLSHLIIISFVLLAAISPGTARKLANENIERLLKLLS
jgi:hypothetical protein